MRRSEGQRRPSGVAEAGLRRGGVRPVRDATSIKDAEPSVATERDICFHIQSGLASTRVVREGARRMLVLGDEHDGGETLLPKRAPPTHWSPRIATAAWCLLIHLFFRPRTRRPILRCLSPVLNRPLFRPGS